MGSTRKTVMTGERLEENLWHTLELKRRGPHISLSVDEEPARMGKLSVSLMPNVRTFPHL